MIKLSGKSRGKEILKFAEESAVYGVLWVLHELVIGIIVWGSLFLAGGIIVLIGAGLGYLAGSGLVILWEWIWY